MPKRPRGFRTAIETLVSEAVILSTGQKTGFDLKFVKPSLSYVVFDPETLEKKYEIEAEDCQDLGSALKRAKDSGLSAVPYFYSGYNTGGNSAGIRLDRGNPVSDLHLALHEKRHSRKSSAGLNHTRLGKAYYEKSPRKGAQKLSDAGLIQEAACEYSATYDLLVLAETCGNPELKRKMKSRAREILKSTDSTRRSIESASSAKLAGDERAFRRALAEFGREISELDSELVVYGELGRAIRNGNCKAEARLERRAKALTFPEKVFADESLYDLLTAKLLHYSDYQNEGVERSVYSLYSEFSPAPKDVASGLAKNPFIDLIGLHKSEEELLETVSFFRKMRRKSREYLKEEISRTAGRVSDGRLSSEKKYALLRELYCLSESARRKGVEFSESLAPLSDVSGEGKFEAGRLMRIYSR